MRELILVVAAVVAWEYAYRWHRLAARAREELATLVTALRTAGLSDAEIARLVTPAVAAAGRAPFEVLRILRKGH